MLDGLLSVVWGWRTAMFQLCDLNWRGLSRDLQRISGHPGVAPIYKRASNFLEAHGTSELLVAVFTTLLFNGQRSIS